MYITGIQFGIFKNFFFCLLACFSTTNRKASYSCDAVHMYKNLSVISRVTFEENAQSSAKDHRK